MLVYLSVCNFKSTFRRLKSCGYALIELYLNYTTIDLIVFHRNVNIFVFIRGVLRMGFFCPVLHFFFWELMLVIVNIPNKVMLCNL